MIYYNKIKELLHIFLFLFLLLFLYIFLFILFLLDDEICFGFNFFFEVK